jgi:hypothetical protein
MDKKHRFEDAIKDLNAIRAVYHREFEKYEKQYKNKDISKKEFEKHKINYEKKREKIRVKIHHFEKELEKLSE